MENSYVSTDFSPRKYKDAELAAKARHILLKMDNNPHFPEPRPAIARLQEKVEDYSDALARVADGTKADTAIKNAKRKALEAMLRQMADYVQYTSAKKLPVLLESGFDIRKKKSVVGELEKPQDFRAKPGPNSGSIRLVCQPVKQARYYEFNFREAAQPENGKWGQKTSTKSRLLLEGLKSGQKYVFRVAALGTKPSRHWSNEISSFVL